MMIHNFLSTRKNIEKDMKLFKCLKENNNNKSRTIKKPHFLFMNCTMLLEVRS